MSIQVFDPYKVQECLALQKLHRSNEAKELLKKVAHQVQPIMRKRQLRVPVLSEFFPRHANLLGLNCGGGGGGTREIKIRLRQAHSKTDFLPFASILGTMLHELCHNHIGPHNQSFFSLLAELQKECEDFMARGVGGTGAGFDAAASGKIGGRWRNPSEAEKRLAILKAAEKRSQASAALNRLMPSGPHQLGGSKAAVSPKEAAASAAMERLKAAEACGCDEVHGTQVTYDDAKGEVIVLDDDDDDHGKNETRGTRGNVEPASRESTSLNPNGLIEEQPHVQIYTPGNKIAPHESARSELVRIQRNPLEGPGLSSSASLGRQQRRQQTSAEGQGPVIDLTEADFEETSPQVQHPTKKWRPGISEDKWQCQSCTFINAGCAAKCEMCEGLRDR